MPPTTQIIVEDATYSEGQFVAVNADRFGTDDTGQPGAVGGDALEPRGGAVVVHEDQRRRCRCW